MSVPALPLPEDIPFVPDPWQAWLDAHREEVARYAGERIAVHPEKGIVAHGKTLTEVCTELDRLGYPRGENDPTGIVVVPEWTRP